MTRNHPNRRQGTFAEEFVADEFGLEHAPNETDWYDCVHPRGTKYEVKSTTRTYSGEYSDGVPGRFRLWEDQHRSLTAAEGSDDQSAWYAFVLLDDGGNVVDVQRRKPSTITEIVDGGWNKAGHSERNGRQRKLSWPEVMG